METNPRKHNPVLTGKAKKLRRDMTKEERHLWYDYLRNYPVRFLRQKVIDQYIADFYCHAARLVVELDGSQHYEEKEQQWINDMSKDGWQCVNYSPFTFTYTFERDPKQYTYRVDFMYGREKDYIEFVESTGAELMWKNSIWAYFRKEASAGDFELYTDVASKMSYLNRLLSLYGMLCVLNALAFLVGMPEYADFSSIRKTIFLLNGTAAAIMGVLAINIVKRKKRLKGNGGVFGG